MIDLNEHAQKAQEIAFNCWKKKGVKYHTPAMLKQCAGEVCEAVEAFDQKKALQECQQKNEARVMEGAK